MKIQLWERFSPRTVVVGWGKHLRGSRPERRQNNTIVGAVLAQNGGGGVAETNPEIAVLGQNGRRTMQLWVAVLAENGGGGVSETLAELPFSARTVVRYKN